MTIENKQPDERAAFEEDPLTYDQALRALTDAYGRGFRATHFTFRDAVGPLSSRLRPGIECAPWVIEEVKKIEARATTQQANKGDERADQFDKWAAASEEEQACSEKRLDTIRWRAKNASRNIAAVAACSEPATNLGAEQSPVIPRDFLGELVRDAWVKWAKQQPNSKPSWLIPYWELSEADKEADRQIGEAVWDWAYRVKGALLGRAAAPQAVTLSDEQITALTDKWSCAWSASGAWNTRRCIDNALREARTLLAAHPTEQRMSDAERDVIAERARQISVEGWTPAHDDGANDVAALADAAACYTRHAAQMLAGAYCAPMEIPHTTWPWDASWWKPTTPRRDLVKAGALILAEIERIDRAARKGDSQ